MSYADLFDRFNESGLRYVVTRKYDFLPENTVHEGNDVDILLSADEFDNGIAICRDLGFSDATAPLSDRLSFYRTGLEKPAEVVNVLLEDPRKMVQMAITGVPPGYDNPRHRDEQLHRDGEIVDLRNNLAYKSPMNELRIPVDPSITEDMFKRRRKQDGIYVPAPCDELAHIIPHCVFDKDGNFSTYYTERCNSLFELVSSHEQQRRHFEDLLRRIFYEADERVFELVADGRYSDLRTELLRFAEY
ncbi:hypothetical protein KTS45_13435 [Halomicroarcula limicola]|uniref:Uncharacterized protein n=1 Tax=Haloarcula limicola TaxID=1429915 RepID=A0A8J7Y6K3_9EURY|nr:hypothetical protein [Halomicroarcula limicola]MBV0925202.1 hypothetical protein [Halomicroarcula limicola]